MLIVRKNLVNNLIATVSMNKTLPNPYYLFSFQHIASKDRISFIPQVITSNVRYDKFRFLEAPTTNLSATPPEVFFNYLGQYYYSIYEQLSPTNTNIDLAYNKLESGRAWVIVGDDNTDECFFEPYISNDEDFSQVIYVSEEEQACQQPLITPTNTPTPSITPSITPTMTTTPTNTPSITPTFTPTPSTTPPAAIDPNTYNALWWVDYTNASSITTAFGTIIQAQNLSTSIGGSFYGNAGSSPVWSSTGYNGVSGATTASATNLSNALGLFGGSYSAFTTFARFKGQSNSTGNIQQSDNDINYSGQTQGYRWFSLSDYLGSFPDFIRTYNFYTDGSSVNPEPQFNYTPNVWYDIAIRVFQTSNTAHTELWVDGVLVDATNQNGSTIRTSTNPIFALMSGFDYQTTEQFFIPSKLSDAEMGVMFNYLSNKY